MTRLSASHNRVGQRWIDQQVWPAECWRDLWREPPAQTGFLPVRQFCKAQIVLSDVVLGAVNSHPAPGAIAPGLCFDWASSRWGSRRDRVAATHRSANVHNGAH